MPHPVDVTPIRPAGDGGATGREGEDDDTKEFMRQTAKALDRLINGDATGGDRANGFVLLVFPVRGRGRPSGQLRQQRCSGRILTALKEIVASSGPGDRTDAAVIPLRHEKASVVMKASPEQPGSVTCMWR